jgi:hypothetical protein
MQSMHGKRKPSRLDLGSMLMQRDAVCMQMHKHTNESSVSIKSQ